MKEIPFARPVLGPEEKDAVLRVLDGSTLVHGPVAHEFEREFAKYTGAPYSISVSSCTAGLHLGAFTLGLAPGDEVIVPAQTHTATAHAVEFMGAKPIFIDAEIKTGNLNLDAIKDKITPRTKAIFIVHFLGMPVQMDRLLEIAGDIPVIEDCALAVGSRYKGIHAGLWGLLGVFSFYPAKHMTTSEGGMIILRDEALTKRLARQKAFGVDRAFHERKTPGIYDVTLLGYNYRMSEIHAAIGREQVKKLPDFHTQRKKNYEALEKELRQIPEISLFETSNQDFESSYYCMSVLLKGKHAANRSAIIDHMKSCGIGTSVYYPKPVPLLSYYKDKYAYKEGEFPVASIISDTSIALPVGPHLTVSDMTTIADELKAALAE